MVTPPLQRCGDFDAPRHAPLYIEDKDRLHKPAAKHAFKALFAQRVGHVDFAVEAAEVYEVVRV